MNPEELHEYLHECAYNGEDPMQKSLQAVKRIPFFGRLLYAYFKRKLERDRNKSWEKSQAWKAKWKLATGTSFDKLAKTSPELEEASRQLRIYTKGLGR